ncbi:MAG: alpha/beta fold hydrolase [Candidatus Limnocylindrales bacterium]
MSVINSKDGTQIAYDQRGDGPALLVVDGALSTRMSGSKAALVDLLAPKFSVCCYDRRGRGDSGDTLPYAVAREIEDIEALIDEAGGVASLYGHSSGGCLALEAAGALGTKVSKVAVYEAPYNDDPAAQQAWGEYLRQLNDALGDDRRGDAVALFMGYVGTPAEQLDGMRRSPFWPDLEAIAPTLAYDHAAIVGRTGAVPTERLAAVRTPTLVMCGGSSFPFMRTTAQTIAQALPNGSLQVLEGQSHDVQPQVLGPVLTEFLLK